MKKYLLIILLCITFFGIGLKYSANAANPNEQYFIDTGEEINDEDLPTNMNMSFAWYTPELQEDKMVPQVLGARITNFEFNSDNHETDLYKQIILALDSELLESFFK